MYSDLKEQSKLIETKDEIISDKTKKVSKLLSEFECEKCQFQTESFMEFNFHLSQKHPVKSTKHHKCQKCDFKCNNENDMKIHKASKHITSKLELNGSRNSEISDNAVVNKAGCDKCDFISTDQFSLLLHKSTKHPTYILNSQPEAVTGPLH